MRISEPNTRFERALTVVVADDDHAICQLVKAILARMGCHVITASCGAEAIARVRQVQPDLVILDYLMPDMDGVRVAETLRAAADTSDVPLLLLSAIDGGSDGNRETETLWDARVTKPFSPAALRAAVAAATNRADALHEECASAKANLGEVISALQAGYLESLAQTLRDIRAALRAAQEQSDVEPHLVDVRRRLHQIRGSAGTFGLANVGRIAGDAEARVVAALESGNGAMAGCVEDVAEAIRAIEARLSADDESRGGSSGHPMPDGSPSCRVLLVDDQTSIAGLRRLARECGYAVEVVDSLASARERMQEQQFALVTLMSSTGLDVDAARAIRSDRSCGPLVLAGGDGSIGHRVAAAHAGVDLYMPGRPDAARLVDAWRLLLDSAAPRAGRVLIVDDDPILLDFERHQLETAGCSVWCIDDPRRVFERLDECEPHLLVLDIDMPSACGLDVARAVRAAERWAHIPILIQTAHTEPAYRLRAFECGADDFITKPVIEDELLVRVLGRLERARLTRELAEKDPVTGLYNLRSFLAHAGRVQIDHDAAVAIIEVEGSTEFARRHGLEAADAALAAAADGVQGGFRTPGCVVGRVGAGVLAVFVPEASAEETTARLAHCIERLEEDPRLSPAGDAAGALHLEAAVLRLEPDTDVVDGLYGALRARRPRRLGQVANVTERAAVACDSVYVVEDDDGLREMMCHALRQAGYCVVSFDNGKSALETLLRHDVRGRRALVLLDVDLPDTDGYGVLTMLESQRPGEFRTIMLAADSAERQRIEALRAGAADYLVKPVRIGHLLDTVSRLGRSR